MYANGVDPMSVRPIDRDAHGPRAYRRVLTGNPERLADESIAPDLRPDRVPRFALAAPAREEERRLATPIVRTQTGPAIGCCLAVRTAHRLWPAMFAFVALPISAETEARWLAAVARFFHHPGGFASRDALASLLGRALRDLQYGRFAGSFRREVFVAAEPWRLRIAYTEPGTTDRRALELDSNAVYDMLFCSGAEVSDFHLLLTGLYLGWFVPADADTLLPLVLAHRLTETREFVGRFMQTAALDRAFPLDSADGFRDAVHCALAAIRFGSADAAFLLLDQERYDALVPPPPPSVGDATAVVQPYLCDCARYVPPTEGYA